MPFRPRTLLVAALAGAIVALPLAAGSASAGPDRPASTSVVPVKRYVADARSATGALGALGTALKRTTSLDQFRGELTALRGRLRTFDASIRRMRGYRLANPVIDGQRSRLARTGIPLAATLSRFLDAVRDNNPTEVRRLVPEVTTGLNRFATAAKVS
jgi:hypothetical protein